MKWPFKRKSTPSDEVYAIYNIIVAQSRQEEFFLDFSIKDNVTGRFDILSMHMCLVFIRLRDAKTDEKDFPQALFDLFFKDMDHSLREIGISDVTIPKKIAKLGSLFYGLLEQLTIAIDANDKDALVNLLNRNIYNEKNLAQSKALANYVLQIDRQLKEQSLSDIFSGKLEFSKPNS